MKFVILTGMSGAGKSTALKMMEDIGFYCVDNLPIPLLEKFVELSEMQNAELQKVAVGIDARSGQALDELKNVLDRIKEKGGSYEILFLDSDDSVLVKRYKETRRSHPLAPGERVDKGIALERERLVFLKERADYQAYILEMLRKENGYQVRPSTAYDPGYGMDVELLFSFLQATQPDALARLEKKPLKKLIGKSFGSVFSNMDSKWLRSYEQAALYGKTLEIVSYSPEIDTNLKIICYPTFKGHCGCILFNLDAADGQLGVLNL